MKAEQSVVHAMYSHDALIDLIIENPTWTHRQYAKHFGQPPSWFATILATDSFQLALDPRRLEISDPSITATMEERLRALTIRSMSVLQTKLENDKVEDFTVLKAMEISSKALGMGVSGRRDGGDAKLPTAPQTLANKAQDLVTNFRNNGTGRLTASVDVQDVEILDRSK